MECTFGNFIIEIDICRTKKFYNELSEIDCNCDGCRNYILATDDFPLEVSKFFKSFCIDPKKATEIITWSSENNGLSLHYGGFYHLCGFLIKGDDLWSNGIIDASEMYSINHNYSIGFTKQISLPEKNLTFPALQMEIDFHSVPWKLNKINKYL